MSSSPSGSSGTGTGRTANVYTPGAQPFADATYWQALSPLLNPTLSGTTPGAWAYPQAQSEVTNFLTQSPYSAEALTGAQQGANIAGPGATAMFTGAGQDIAGAGQVQGLAGQTAGLAPSDLSAAAASQTLGGQDIGLGNAAIGVAGQAAGLPAQDIALAQGTAGLGTQTAGLAGQLTPNIPTMFGAGNAILDTAFDPQAALFNRTQQQLIDQSNAVNAMSGVASTPYGASTTENALGNFDINWANNQLARQQQGIAGAGTAYGTGLNLAQGAGGLLTGAGGLNAAAGGLYGGAGGLYSGEANILGGAGNLFGGAGNLFGQSGNLTGQAGNLYGQSGNLYGQGANLQGAAGNLFGGAANLAATGGALPYSSGSTIASNALSGLGSATNLGNNQYQIPQQVVNDLESYLNLGQSASTISGQLGQLGLNQLGQTAGGFGALAGSGLGLGTPSNPGYLASGIGSLFGSSGGSDLIAPLAGTAGTEFGGGGDLAAVAPLAAAGS